MTGGPQEFSRRLLNRVTTRQSPKFKIFRDLVEKQFSSENEFRDQQRRALTRLLRHAIKNVPYYSGERGVRPEEDALESFPVLTKQSIAECGDALHSRDRASRRAYANSSGGTTGQPTRILQDPHYYEHAGAQTLLAWSWRGVGPFDRVARLWGAKRDLGSAGLLGAAKNYLRNRVILDCFRMSDADMARHIRVLNDFRPRLLVAYSNAAYELARFAAREGLQIRDIPAIHTSAGMLYPHMRDQIESVFGGKVYNHYGAREVGSIASECSVHSGLHILADHVLVEVVDDQNRPRARNQQGRILVTSLANYSMPLIRYEIGDHGAMSNSEQCPCGRVYPLLDHVSGRVGQTLRARDGSIVDSNFFVHIVGVVNHHPSVRRFQIVQTALDRFLVRFVLVGPLPSSVYNGIRRSIQDRLGDVNVSFEHVSGIEPSQNGKVQIVLSEIETATESLQVVK